MSKHTPGPWTYKMDKDCLNLSVTTAYAPTEIVGGCGCCDSPWVSCEADARLIAAAPDLLEALEEAVVLLAIFGVGMETKTYKRSKAAIAKAKGEE